MIKIIEKMGKLNRNLNLQWKKLKSELVVEVTHVSYVNQRKKKSDQNNYDIISLMVVSFLKEQGTPVKVKKIHRFLTEEKYHSISYANLPKQLFIKNESR